MIKWLQQQYFKIKIYFLHRKKIKELKKKDPFVYKG